MGPLIKTVKVVTKGVTKRITTKGVVKGIKIVTTIPTIKEATIKVVTVMVAGHQIIKVAVMT